MVRGLVFFFGCLNWIVRGRNAADDLYGKQGGGPVDLAGTRSAESVPASLRPPRAAHGPAAARPPKQATQSAG
eukprot:scaffold78938_cov63-Phaeocystis_antarctica.AAC.2